MNTVKVLYSRINPENLIQFNYIIEQLGNLDKLRLKRLVGKRKIQFLTGRNLLKLGIESFGLDNKLNQLKFSHNMKPFFKHNINFSISHSNEIVCCALIDKKIKLGIDIEYHKIKNLTKSPCFFTEKEIQEIHHNEMLIYDFWTKKESLIKACSDNIFNMNKIDCLEKTICYRNDNWFFYKLNSSNNYITYLAANKKISVKETWIN